MQASLPFETRSAQQVWRSRAVRLAAWLAAAWLLASCAPATTLVALAPVTTGASQAAPPTPIMVAGIEEGLASWYGPGFAGRRTASGEIFDPSEMTAAHKTLPFGTRVRVTSLRSGRSVVVRINDRGPFKPGRIIDLSRAAAESIGLISAGVARVSVAPLGSAGTPVRVAVGPGLNAYEVITPRYPIGTLLVVSGAENGAQALVRVVANEPVLNGETVMLVSPELLAAVGTMVIIASE